MLVTLPSTSWGLYGKSHKCYLPFSQPIVIKHLLYVRHGSRSSATAMNKYPLWCGLRSGGRRLTMNKQISILGSITPWRKNIRVKGWRTRSVTKGHQGRDLWLLERRVLPISPKQRNRWQSRHIGLDYIFFFYIHNRLILCSLLTVRG